ncbi:MAG: hypothetical protein EOP87_03680 [Verrucomicrobiaceae bacterium]|nr:MAG: hypothetical protein EOP87_03680 [Verrucomicrobiaceae bacterium]
MKTRIFSLFAALLYCGFASGAVTIYYSNDNAPGFEVRDQNGVPLSPGFINNPRDGTYFEIAYYNLATTSNPFAGDWVPMVGPEIGASNFATIGDRDVNGAAGIFSWLNEIDSSDATRDGYNLPGTGTPLSIRFYNAQRQSPSNLFNAVSSLGWAWPEVDPDSTMIMDLTTDVLLWQGGDSSAFRTTLPIPEISTSLLVMLGSAVSLTRRKRRPVANAVRYSAGESITR